MLKAFFSLLSGGDRPDPQHVVAEVGAKRAILIDVREPGEIAGSGKAKGAVHLPLSRFPACVDPNSGHFDKHLKKALREEMPVYLYCASGMRSQRAAALMKAKGFNSAQNIGSLRAWAKGGGQIIR